jgi:hypothetical protein
MDVDGTSAGSTTTTVSGLNVAFNDAVIYKSIPTVAKIDFTGTGIVGNDTYNLYKFSVTADSAGPVGLYRLTFGVSTTTVSLNTSGYYLYESTSASSLGTIIAKGSDITTTDVDGSASDVLRVYFDVNDDNANSPAKEHRILSAGTTRYYTLRGTTRTGHDGTTGNESVSTVMASDASFGSTAVKDADALIAASDQNKFIWSDLNFDLYSTSTATTTEGWFNGYRIPGLESTSTTAQTIDG